MVILTVGMTAEMTAGMTVAMIIGMITGKFFTLCNNRIVSKFSRIDLIHNAINNFCLLKIGMITMTAEMTVPMTIGMIIGKFFTL